MELLDGSVITSVDCSLAEVDPSILERNDGDKRTCCDRLLGEIRKRNPASQGTHRCSQSVQVSNQDVEPVTCAHQCGRRMGLLVLGRRIIHRFLPWVCPENEVQLLRRKNVSSQSLGKISLENSFIRPIPDQGLIRGRAAFVVLRNQKIPLVTRI